jgi:hypothetical protein
MKLSGTPGQLGLRFGGFGRIVNGAGFFQGAEGPMTDNSVVGIAPTPYRLFIYCACTILDGRYRGVVSTSQAHTTETLSGSSMPLAHELRGAFEHRSRGNLQRLIGTSTLFTPLTRLWY